jgi:hypothetical protein
VNHKRRLVLATLLVPVLALIILPHAQEWERAKFVPPKEIPVIQAKHDTMKEKRANAKMAKAYAQAGFGWQGGEWKCLRTLWTFESRFDSKANNPRSSAFGIAQLLKETSTDPAIQILKGLRYIKHRYSSPCRALAKWKREKARGNPWY